MCPEVALLDGAELAELALPDLHLVVDRVDVDLLQALLLGDEIAERAGVDLFAIGVVPGKRRYNEKQSDCLLFVSVLEDCKGIVKGIVDIELNTPSTFINAKSKPTQ